MAHAMENWLRGLYDRFALGDFPGYLDACTDDVTFAVPGYASVSGTYTRDEFLGWLTACVAKTGGTFHADVITIFANDEHGVVLLAVDFDRDGDHFGYQNAHLLEFRDGKIARWVEHPGSMREFEAAWGTHETTPGPGA
ncbi:MAG TPA: nuclear transport factor 2 family protein [Acidimicrobiia bacterium]|nr:nuclear transport factor 2 family protein [Acidimicrobiia bacterium]